MAALCRGRSTSSLSGEPSGSPDAVQALLDGSMKNIKDGGLQRFAYLSVYCGSELELSCPKVSS